MPNILCVADPKQVVTGRRITSSGSVPHVDQNFPDVVQSTASLA